MKHSPFTGVLFFAALVCFFISCGGDGAKEEATTDTTTADTTTSVVIAPASTIVTTPETMMVTNFKVADYAKWLTAYEAGDSMRKANGIRAYVVGRGVADSNTVLVAQKVTDIALAKTFAKGAWLKQAMKNSGVKGAPSMTFATTTWQDTANIGPQIRSRTTFTVKDWAAWLKNFEEGNQERVDNGLAVRVVGHDADDDKKVMLVTAVTDTAKARAYWNSDQLKKRREAGGVLTEPQRFLFHVVKRYY